MANNETGGPSRPRQRRPDERTRSPRRPADQRPDRPQARTQQTEQMQAARQRAKRRAAEREQSAGRQGSAQQPRRKKHASTRRRHGGVLLRLLTMLVIVAVFILGVAIFFKVTDVQVTGNQKYTAEEVIAASGIQTGDNLMTLNKASIAGKLIALLPYVEQVHISRVLPDTVVLALEESDAAYAVTADDGTSWLVSASGKVLEQATVSAADYPKITGITLQSPQAGQQAVCEQTENLEAAKLVMEELESTSFISQITEINVEKTYDIVIWYGTQFEVELGGTDEMAYKIQFLGSILDQLKEEQGGTVDLTLEEKNSAIFTPWQNSQELNTDSEEKTAENS